MTNAETVRSAYEAFARADVPAILETFAEKIVWSEAEGHPYGGEYTTPEGVVDGVFVPLATRWDHFSADVDHVIDGGSDLLVAVGRDGGRYKANGNVINIPFAHVWTMRDGKAIHVRQHTDTALFQLAVSGD